MQAITLRTARYAQMKRDHPLSTRITAPPSLITLSESKVPTGFVLTLMRVIAILSVRIPGDARSMSLLFITGH